MLIVAFIGFGNSVCRYHLPYLETRKDFIKVKYIFRREEDRLGDTERELWYPEVTFTSNIDTVMNDPEVNLVVVNTPNEFHVTYSMLALKNGKNVLCEKPFALSSEEAKKVFEYAKKRKLIAMSNQNRRYDADILTLKKVIKSGVLGELVELESHYDYFRPQIGQIKRMGYLYGLAVHPLDQIISLFGRPKKVVFDCRSIEKPGDSDDYYDIDLFYNSGFKAIVKTSFYVKLDYPRFILHGKKGSFLMPALEHNSNSSMEQGPVQINYEPLSEQTRGTISYIDVDGMEINKKIPTECCDYGIIYDQMHEAIINGAEKDITDEEVLTVLDIIESGTLVAKEALT